MLVLYQNNIVNYNYCQQSLFLNIQTDVIFNKNLFFIIVIGSLETVDSIIKFYYVTL
jgi:hypothetical protein